MITATTFPSGLDPDHTLTIDPDYLKNWEKNRVVWKPGEPDDDGQVVMNFMLPDDDKPRSVIARSEMMVITGPPKARKTLLLQSMIMSNFLKQKDYIKTLRFNLDLGQNTILMFDTEQPRRRSKKNRRRFHNIVNAQSDLDRYFEMNIKKFSHVQKIDLITRTIEEVQHRIGEPIGMLIIDQIADLCPSRDVNDQSGVNEILDHLNMWQELTMNTSVQAVTIHTNRGRLDTNGKLGVMLDQKTDCTFHVDIDHKDKISVVTHKESRERPVPGFTFTQDSYGLPKLLVVDDDYF